MRTLHLLVVDDFEPFRQVIRAILGERTEFRVVEASDGLEALWKAERLQPDLVLLDIGLPSLNGIEVSKCASRVVPAAKIVFLSQECSREVVQEALRAGGLGYVRKSHAQSDLLSAIDSGLEGRRFMSSGLIDLPPQAGQNSKEPEYPWQQKVMDAFRASPDSLPLRINIAERAIAARLIDRSQEDLGEYLALRRALQSLRALIAETGARSTASDKSEKKDIA